MSDNYLISEFQLNNVFFDNFKYVPENEKIKLEFIISSEQKDSLIELFKEKEINKFILL